MSDDLNINKNRNNQIKTNLNGYKNILEQLNIRK